MFGGRKGFTLIELLVVIAIIAMLLAILMPALGKVKEKAKEVVCRSNLRQWGQIFHLYTADNDGYFMMNRFGEDTNGDGVQESGEGTWIIPLDPYYSGGASEKLCICPSTNRTEDEGENEPGKMVWDTNIAGKEYRNTYAINNWIYRRQSPSQESWQRIDQKGQAIIPMFLEGWRWGGGMTTRSDVPPPDKDRKYNTGPGRFCIDRHNLAINVCFMDGHIEQVGLKGLWDMKWHKQYDMTAALPEWPTWMQSAKD